MSTTDEHRQKEDWSYYYALYHMLAHWAAYLTILVLLLTVPVLWNTSQSAAHPHPIGAAVSLAALCGVEIYLVWRISKESNYLLRKLPLSSRPPALIEPLHKHGTMIFIGIGFAPVAFTLWDILLIFGRL